MNFSDAVRQSMQSFLEGKLDLSEVKRSQDGYVKFTKEYFDELEEQLEEMPEEEQQDED